MKVFLEAQKACSAELTGLGQYTVNLYRQLIRRRQNDYELIFFDKDKGYNNRKWIDKHFAGCPVKINEYNHVSYGDFLDKPDMYEKSSYNEYTGLYGDVFHFPHVNCVPGKLKGRAVVTVHDLFPITAPYLFSERMVKSFKLNMENIEKLQPYILVDSQYTKNEVVDIWNIPPERVHVTLLAHNSDICYFEENSLYLQKAGINKPYILFFASIDQRKNLSRVIEAFEQIAEKNKDILLVMAGGTIFNSEPIMQKAAASFYSNRIIMPGYVTEDEKRFLMSGAELFIFPSLLEGFGIPVLEAMACGCPVITSDTSSLPEVAGEAGILIDPYNTDEIACQMQRVLESKSLQDSLREKSFEQAEKFSWDKTAARTEEVYKLAYEE